ncbi:stage V sporulation protein AB [Paenibacillus sp. Marseille-Q4541]|uniref:stage V sporulation protein AB n=1 Tax=Paenibacillus sp. Marseille-Q4541 TaxID=2831522 RepID=UPI001BA96164|nr:stage V sporulation protein AB [Paenibacillus sp. Marseille-Q4541]
MTVLDGVIIMFLGVASGIAVGSGVIALFIVLDMIPRLAQLTRSYNKAHAYEVAMISGSLIGTVADFWHLKMRLLPVVSIFVGLLCGVFIGLLAAALTEVLNVLPILAKRLGMKPYLFGLLMAMVFGKVAGSLFDWFVFAK